MTTDKAAQIQKGLAALVSKQNDTGEVRLIAGVDISAPDSDGYARAAIVILSYPNMKLMEVKVVNHEVTFPYIPGFLSFRECQPIVAAGEKLDMEPDLVLIDGQGIAHPRRLGLASHLGLIWDKPTVGCAKSRLCGEHQIVPGDKGDYAEINDKGELIGVALRTKSGAKPLYVSLGHRIDLYAAVQWVLNCCRGYRLPEPTRLAHLAASGRLQ